MTTQIKFSNQVALELRAEMGRQALTPPALASALNCDIRTARGKYRGTTQMTFVEVGIVAAWLNVDKTQLLKGYLAEAN